MRRAYRFRCYMAVGAFSAAVSSWQFCSTRSIDPDNRDGRVGAGPTFPDKVGPEVYGVRYSRKSGPTCRTGRGPAVAKVGRRPATCGHYGIQTHSLLGRAARCLATAPSDR